MLKISFSHSWKERTLKFLNSMAYSHIAATLFKLLNIQRFQIVGWEETALFQSLPGLHCELPLTLFS
jgi:hypothetical protein